MRELTGMRVLMARIVFLIAALCTTVAMAEDRPRIVAANYALQYLAERLVGDAAEVTYPVPADVDPSYWRPSVADISAMQSADLVLLNGASFSAWVDRVSLPRSKVVNTSAAIKDRYIVTESVTHSHGDGGAHSHDAVASYLWLDPTLAIAQAEAIAGAVSARSLAPVDAVWQRLGELRGELEDLDAQAGAELSGLEGVAMIATHPRYQYFARRYGLTIEALEWEAGAMPSAEELAGLEALARETGAEVMIWEAAPPAEALEAVSKLGLQSVTFAPLAHRDAERGFEEAFAQAVEAIARVAGQAGN